MGLTVYCDVMYIVQYVQSLSTMEANLSLPEIIPLSRKKKESLKGQSSPGIIQYLATTFSNVNFNKMLMLTLCLYVKSPNGISPEQ